MLAHLHPSHPSLPLSPLVPYSFPGHLPTTLTHTSESPNDNINLIQFGSKRSKVKATIQVEHIQVMFGINLKGKDFKVLTLLGTIPLTTGSIGIFIVGSYE